MDVQTFVYQNSIYSIVSCSSSTRTEVRNGGERETMVVVGGCDDAEEFQLDFGMCSYGSTSISIYATYVVCTSTLNTASSVPNMVVSFGDTSRQNALIFSLSLYGNNNCCSHMYILWPNNSGTLFVCRYIPYNQNKCTAVRDLRYKSYISLERNRLYNTKSGKSWV